MTDETSKELYARAKLRMPGGVNSPVRAYQAVGRTPRFIKSASGSHITDVDGNEMIDYMQDGWETPKKVVYIKKENQQ